jgi:site-specific recombinase XerC
MGKGRKEREVFFSNETYAALLSSLNDRGLPLSGWLFRSDKTGEPVSARYVQKYLADLGEDLKIEVTPHTLRHTFATNALQVTDNLAHIKELLGHSSVATTQRYVQSRNAMNLHDVAFQIMEAHRVGAEEARWV